MTSWPARVGSPGPGTPLFEQVALDLTEALFAEPPPKGKLPSETELCLRFGISRTTLRRAVDVLESRGLVIRRHGLGTFFVGGNVMAPDSEPIATMDILRSIPGFHSRCLTASTTTPPQAVQATLSVPARASVVHIRRLDCVGEAPLALVDAFLPTTILPSVTASEVENESVYSILAHRGMPITRIDQTIHSERWADADGAHVGATKDECALVLERTAFSIGGDAVEHSILRFRSQTVRIEMSLTPSGRLAKPLQLEVHQT